MEKLKLVSYTDAQFSSKYFKEDLLLDVDPSDVKLEKGIVYNEDKQLGSLNSSNSFDRYRPEIMSFNFIIDATCVLDATSEVESIKIYDIISDVESYLYCYNSDGHRPSYVMIAYGELLFKGQLTKMNVEYKLFSPRGVPLRAKVDLTFSSYCDSAEAKRKFGKLSPDMSRLITLKAGDSLIALCNEIYEDSLLVEQVARFNSLNGFRDIPAGTKILFPHLKKG